jgi:hypothetical protein
MTLRFQFLMRLAVALTTVAVLLAPGQQASPPSAQAQPQQAQQQAPVAASASRPGKSDFSAAAHLVIVDVTVKDKSGKVIDNLKDTDFAVFEDGKPQKVAVFEAQKLTTEPEPPEEVKLTDQLARISGEEDHQGRHGRRALVHQPGLYPERFHQQSRHAYRRDQRAAHR